MGKADHAVGRQEVLAGPKDRGGFYGTGNSFESVDMISLDIMSLFFSGGEGAYGMAFDHTCDRVCAQDPQGMVDRTPGTRRPSGHKVSFFNSPFFHKVCPERHYEFACRRLTWQREEDEVIFFPDHIGSGVSWTFQRDYDLLPSRNIFRSRKILPAHKIFFIDIVERAEAYLC